MPIAFYDDATALIRSPPRSGEAALGRPLRIQQSPADQRHGDRRLSTAFDAQ